MSTLDQIYDSLPYIDREPTQAERERILASLNANIPTNARTKLHPSVTPLPESSFSHRIKLELERVANEQKLSAIDKSRYEALDPPEDGSDDANAWQTTLRRAYAVHSHLTAREANLSMLEESGRNAWLIGNFQLEQELKAIEKQIAEMQEASNGTNQNRKATQEAAHGELQALEETWTKGVGRMLEVEVAAEKLRLEALNFDSKTATG